jgi:hypothetical protein
LNDYYSAIKGGLTDGQELIITGTKSQSGGAKISGIGGTLESETASEVREKVLLTDAAKFDELYKLMELQGDIQYLDCFDKEIWETIKRREILEIEVSVKVPELYKTMSAIGDIMPLMGALEQIMGKDMFKNEEEKNVVTGVMSMVNLENSESIPLICESESTKGYKFIVELQKSFLRMDVTNLNGEMTLFGKVQKIVPEGVEVEVYNMFSNFKALMEIGNKNSDTNTEQFTEKVTGPAMKIIPLAIYR